MDRPLTIALANSGRKWIGEIAHVAMLYEQLEALGHRPWIVCRRGFALHRHAQQAGWRCLDLTFHNRFVPWLDAADILRWARWVRQEHVDVIHCHRGKDHWLGLAVARLTGRPLVRTRHVMVPVQRHPLNRWLYLRATDAVLSVSAAVRAGFGPWVDRLPDGRVVLAAVDTEKFSPARRDHTWRQPAAPESAGEPLWFGLVGRYQNIKGHAVFLEAAARVAPQCPEARFYLAGSGSESRRECLGRQAERLGLAARVRIAGFEPDLPRALASLDVGVIASLGSEGSSRIALEMMASGLPLVATRVGGIPELAEPVPGGTRLVGPGFPEAMASAMLAWARDPAAREEASAAHRARAVACHQPRDWAGRMIEVYRAVRACKGLDKP
jgi:glycosyltransferase involved in cell wall biosynthesis